jgi:hypothetical protein
VNRTPFTSSISCLTCVVLAILLTSVSGSVWADPPAQQSNEADAAKKSTEESAKAWKPLAGKWKVCQFGGDGNVEITDELIKLGLGDPLTGIRWEGDVLREGYELELEARRTDGFDFFCGLTFPVGEDHVTLIMGGWGGGVVGISSVDGRDASENDTTTFRNFDNETWYKVRVRVESEQIQCWIDDKNVVQQERKGRKFGIRYEMDLSVPLGIAAFQCDSEIRKLRVRPLTPEELAAKPAQEVEPVKAELE